MDNFLTHLGEIINFPHLQIVNEKQFETFSETRENNENLKNYLKIIEEIAISLKFDNLDLYGKIWSALKQFPTEEIQCKKVSIQVNSILNVLKLKLDFFQPLSFGKSQMESFPELFEIYSNMIKLNLPINKKKLFACLQDFYGMKRFWIGLHEKELGVFIDLLNSGKISMKSKILIDKIFSKIPGSVDPHLTTTIDLAGKVDNIEFGTFQKHSKITKKNSLVQNVIVSIQSNKFPCFFIKKYTTKIVNEEKISETAEKIKKINLAARGSIIKIFAYYNSCTYFKVKAKIIERFEFLQLTKEILQNTEALNKELFIKQIKNIKKTFRSFEKINLLPESLTQNNFGLKGNKLKLLNIHKAQKKETLCYLNPPIVIFQGRINLRSCFFALGIIGLILFTINSAQEEPEYSQTLIKSLESYINQWIPNDSQGNNIRISQVQIILEQATSNNNIVFNLFKKLLTFSIDKIYDLSISAKSGSSSLNNPE